MRPRGLVFLLGIVLVIAIAFSLRLHGANGDERLVERVIIAVQNNDVDPVRKDFDAAAQASITHERVGRLSDLLAAMGKLKSIDEMTPKTGAARHVYVVHFEHGDWEAMMPLDKHGKATGFAMRRMQT